MNTDLATHLYGQGYEENYLPDLAEKLTPESMQEFLGYLRESGDHTDALLTEEDIYGKDR